MPINAGPEYFEAERKFLSAKSKEEKIKYLEEMIRALPKHKGTENALALLKKRLAKLKSESAAKISSRKTFSLKKEGAARVCILGLTQVGKSTLLKSLTNARVKIGDHPFTTKKPEVGMMFYGDVQIQLVEIPSTFDGEFMSIVHASDLILVLCGDDGEEMKMQKILDTNNFGKKKVLFVRDWNSIPKLKEKIWGNLNLIRVYTKSPSKPKEVPPVALKPDSIVEDLAKEIHKDFLKNFKFARIFNDTKFSGQKVGLKYRLKDMDVVEIHTG